MISKVALVTGAGKRIGRSVAMRLAQDGAHVIVHYRSSEAEAQEVVKGIERLGRRSLAIGADLTRVEEIRALFQAVAEKLGRLDLLVNSAANFNHTPFVSTSEQSWDSSLDTNLKAVFFCCQAAAPLLQATRGSIVNFSDIGGLLGWPGYIPHCVSKAGIVMLTRCLAKELAPEVRVNAIAPGTITMPGDPAEWEADYVRLAPLGRSGRTGDVADAVAYISSASFLTGQVVILDGGRTL
jgi:NAD(P)-dependent dehydrogenase (short-subunit alcohol dehydrogenase family)